MSKAKKHITIYYHVSRVWPASWVIAWATPDGHGYRISAPLGSYATRPEAVRARRAIYDELGLYAMSERSAEVRERARQRRQWLKKRAEASRRIAGRAHEIINRKGCSLREALKQARAEVSP